MSQRLPTAPAGHTSVPAHMLQGQRVCLRPWQTDDLPALAQLNADAQTMRHFPAPLTRAASDRLAARCQALIDERGWGFWAVELHANDGRPPACIGMTGLHTPAADLPCAPCVEVGWRLQRAHWGRGLACEAASLALRAGFEALHLSEIVAFTAQGNAPSRALMERLGMRRDARDDFEHPALEPGHALRRHVLYRLAYKDWHAACSRPGTAPAHR